MDEKLIFSQQELVLQVNSNYDPAKLPLKDWEAYIDALCGDRTYQAEAIRSAVIYLAGGRYENLSALAEENYRNNAELEKRFGSREDYLKQLQLPQKLYATLDLATGTGKSYVIFAVAQIMMGLGLADRVLVLCPSVTIEQELMKKFVQLCTDTRLRQLIPQSAVHANIRIVNAAQTVTAGDICVENIHAVYENTGSSILDSFAGKGETTLVLNDEVHHVFNRVSTNDAEGRDIKKWKEFLLSKEFGFQRMLGFTGTAYIDDNYFADVIYRYSLRKAIEDGVIKNVEYVQKDDSIGANEKFQKIYENHRYNQDRYPRVKPITIMVVKDIRSAENLYEDLLEFLVKKEQTDREICERKTLIVTSNKKHRANVERLKYVDSKEDSVEWIISVSMLTEGWDVKNVFQIVPWEDRAFHSRLLIAQVLGRGLRLPEEYRSPQPKVTVFNHDSWSRNIKQLVREILEIEVRISSTVLTEGMRAEHHFDLYNFHYDRKEEEVERTSSSNTFDFSRLQREGIKLESQVLQAEKNAVFESVQGNVSREKNYEIDFVSSSVEEVLDKLYIEFEIRSWEGRILKLGDTEYTKDHLPPREEIEAIIRKSMERVGIRGEQIVEKNVYRILNAFSTLLRKTKKTVVQTVVTDVPFRISTRDMNKYSYSLSNFKSGSSAFYSSDWETEIKDPEQVKILEEIIEDDMLPKRAAKEINVYQFKTPLDVVVTSQNPEMKFVDALCRVSAAGVVSSWVKSRDRDFYPIQYALKYGGRESKTRTYSHKQFNPDFFLKIEKTDMEYIVAVETKEDGDVSDVNLAKYKAAKRHFAELNEKLAAAGISQRYLFHFLSPVSYPEFFAYLKDGQMFEGKFCSELDTLLEEYSEQN